MSMCRVFFCVFGRQCLLSPVCSLGKTLLPLALLHSLLQDQICLLLQVFLDFLLLHYSPKIPWKRKWQPTPVFLLGESHGQRSLVGYSPRVAKTRLSGFTFTFIMKRTYFFGWVSKFLLLSKFPLLMKTSIRLE